jgi:hypothetical protein
MSREDASVVYTRNVSIHDRRSTPSTEDPSRCYRREGKKALLEDAPGMSNNNLERHGGHSTKREATRILSVAPRVISPRMQRSFVDR